MAQSQNPNTQSVEQELEQLTVQAREACSTNGAVSSECAAAWDAVEEVQAAISHRRGEEKSDFQRYCEDRPDAAECRIYDV